MSLIFIIKPLFLHEQKDLCIYTVTENSHRFPNVSKKGIPCSSEKEKEFKKSSEKMQTEVEHQKDNNMTVKQNGFYAYETNSEFNV